MAQGAGEGGLQQSVIAHGGLTAQGTLGDMQQLGQRQVDHCPRVALAPPRNVAAPHPEPGQATRPGYGFRHTRGSLAGPLPALAAAPTRRAGAAPRPRRRSIAKSSPYRHGISIDTGSGLHSLPLVGDPQMPARTTPAAIAKFGGTRSRLVTPLRSIYLG